MGCFASHRLHPTVVWLGNYYYGRNFQVAKGADCAPPPRKGWTRSGNQQGQLACDTRPTKSIVLSPIWSTVGNLKLHVLVSGYFEYGGAGKEFFRGLVEHSS
jgi:hypothetical protein